MMDTEAARRYANTPLGIRPAEYGAFLDGRVSLRKELESVRSDLQYIYAGLARHGEVPPCTSEYLSRCIDALDGKPAHPSRDAEGRGA